MAQRSYRFLVLIEMLDHPDDMWVKPEILRGAATRQDQTVVVGRVHQAEGEVEREVMAWFFAVGLVAFEIVYRSAHGIAGLLARTYRMHHVSYGLQRLEGNHGFV